jgi:hypothetical protein
MLLPLLCLVGAALVGCRPGGSPARSERGDKTPAAVQFVDVTEAVGIRFVHSRGLTGKKYMPETTGSGCAFLDYDNDGWQDILLVNSGAWPDPTLPNQKPPRPCLALYRNEGGKAFRDVTEAAGLAIPMYGMGVCAGDYDNDGDLDIYLTCLGPNYLFRNNGDGTFTDVSAQSGTRGVPFPPGGLTWKWSSACAFLDYDRDGFIDLLVGNYVKWTPQTDVWCGKPGGPKAYCPPHSYPGLPVTVYRNNGNGTFTDVTRALGVDTHIGKVWGIVAGDFNGDGWEDFAVANDTVPNFLFRNEQGKRFTEAGLLMGIAVSSLGMARAGMGIDTADWRNDGRYGLLIGNFAAEGLGLYANDASGFTDVATQAGVFQPSLRFLTFGLFFFDFNNDGWQDAFCANGHIDDLINQYDTTIHYEQRPLLFENRQGQFQEVGEAAGEALRQPYLLRGCAYGDYDNDGDLDILIMPNNDKPARLWRNEGGNKRPWIRFQLQGAKANRAGIGAQVRLKTSEHAQRQYVKAGSGYLSQSDLRLHFGLGDSAAVTEIEVVWPGGRTERHGPLEANWEYLLREGQPITPIPEPRNAGTPAH